MGRGITINQRTPICSYSLRFDPPKNNPLFVEFHGNHGNVRHMLSRKGCKNICGYNGEDYRNPKQVMVYERVFISGVWQIELIDRRNNYIELYSQNGCPDGSIIRNRRGETALTYEPNLEELTNSGNSAVGAFRIQRIRSY